MDVIISARHFEVTDDLRATIEEKMAVIAGEYHKLTKAIAVMDVEKGRQFVEIQLHGKHLEMVAKSETHDMYESIDEAVEKLERQLRRHLDRIQDHRVHKPEAKIEDQISAQDASEDVEDELEEAEEVPVAPAMARA